MKPNSVTDRNNTTFPLTDCNYYSVTLSDYRGRCVKPLAQPFRNISCQYFKREARRDFVGEAVLFAILVITAAVPLVSGASAVIEPCRAFGQL
jgi:hypothetical protein